ncbi:Cytoplasmic tRNA 2-thiolation protein 2 [Rhizoclosmatium sp. JEL0117]|nr:Cytoplasmic tRNA 2-thiolation protein 2 [Rhizoclosmatium sp. JEL0117]
MPLCAKCVRDGNGDRASVIATRGSEYCADCFKVDMFGRFTKAYTTKESLLPRGEPVCVAWSGGLSSSLLVHYMNLFLNKNFKQNVSPRFSVVYVCVVDYSCLLPEEKQQIVNQEIEAMQSIAEGYNFNFKRIPLESAFTNENGDLDSTLVADLTSPEILQLKFESCSTSKTSTATPVSRTLDLFASFKSTPAANPTTAVTLLNTLTTRLLRRAASTYNCTTLMTGSNASTIAAQIVTQTALGGGFNLPNEISLEYKVPNTDIVTFRPIRDLLFGEVEKLVELDEIAQFPGVAGMAEGLFGGVVGSVGTEGASVAKMTIQDLAASFVKGLQKDFPQSVSTVTRTAFKVQTGANAPGLDVCLLCSNPIQPNSQNWRASHTTSRLDDIPDIIKNEDGTVVEAPKKASEVPATGAADLLLCYACQHVGRDVKVKEKLVLPGGDWFLGAKKDCFVGNGCCDSGVSD